MDRPNILLVMADQLSAAALPAYGHEVVQSPAIDALADSGVVFENPYCASPLCAPSRFSMMTGQLPSRIGAYDNAAELPSSFPTMAHYLRLAGYQTSLVGKMHFVGGDQLHGYEERRTTDIYPADFGWTPDWEAPAERVDWWYHNMASVKEAGAAEATNQLDFDDEVGHQAIRKIRELARTDDERPFFLTVSFTHPHDPYAMRPEYLARYNRDEIDLPVVGPIPYDQLDPHSQRLYDVSDIGAVDISEEDVISARHAYYAAISYVDDWVAKIMETLRRCELDDNTVVVFTADHGDLLGERGLWYKMSFFERSVAVPLIISGPGRFAPGRADTPVSHLDLLPTFTELAELDPALLVEPLDGVSLVPCLTEGTTEDRPVVAEYMGEGSVSPMVMIRKGNLKYIACPSDPPQLFDLHADPHELTNLAADPAYGHDLAAFARAAAEHWNVEAVTDAVLTSQRSRTVVRDALRQGDQTPWDHQPTTDAANQYMRNHLDLNDVERDARFPPARMMRPE